MKRLSIILLLIACIVGRVNAQRFNTPDQLNQLRPLQDSLVKLGRQMFNNENDLERKNANYSFIRTLVKALKVPNSYAFNFDSLKTISILRSPDNKFRLLSWFIMNEDGSYRFFGTIQVNTGGKLLLHPLEDYSPLLKNPEDSVVNNHKWFGAQYYKIIPVGTANPYYVLLGWKGNTVKSTKKVIDVLSFKKGEPVFGMPVFQGNKKTRNRVVFEYNRQTSMLLRYIPDQDLIVFDHLAPPDDKLKDQRDTYGPDLTYDGYKLSNGKWMYKDNLDMRNIPAPDDVDIIDPKKQALKDRSLVPLKRN
ncbi:hypothetical protein [Mucilaginibacter aquatilis]|uniref:DUF1571 domain-containing protein n=1 Tax=Mucilaginibacter aquatilis TaxID=1517760 RepID=A0A6I4IBV1_9SPHI|nr:hypothetical protein [Mucilaginibacter aquatilis]MVN92705.1 hypothetical protein [Mucilaginibacter aquatilis]